jgi:hypothetical protein
MARGAPEPTVHGASGDNRDVTSNVGGNKHWDKGMSSDTSVTGSPAGTKIVEEKAKENEKK